ncbi:MAG: hypothetical protein KGJ62_02610 [Armatimonadetes bacterium]|nr:hypothetical protein [Armatimonadota bacterium]MDE2205288.1 hypothetical protein [Armatimonadota bacterium]
MHPERTGIYLLACAAASCAGAQVRHAAPPQTAIRYGIFHLSGFTHGTAGPGGATVSGPNTRVTLDDSAHGASGTLGAPTISVSVDSKSHAWVARLTGGVQFRIVQSAKAGARSTIGSASAAQYDSGAATVRLSGGVSAAVTDPAILAGAAAIHVSRLTMRMSGDHRIELFGTASQDSISAYPLPRKGAHPNAGADHVVIAGFSQGLVTQSRIAQFTGTEVKAVVTQPSGGMASISGTSLAVTGTNKGVTSAEAAGPVTVTVSRPATKLNGAFAASGAAGVGHLDIADHTALLERHVQLQASFAGGRAVVTCDSLKAAWGKALRFFASGAPDHAMLRFIPSAKTAGAPPVASTGSLDGTVNLQRFDSAEEAGGTSLTAAGASMVIQAASGDDTSSAVIHAHHLTAAIEKGALSSAQAWGELSFRFRRTAPAPQSLTGTGVRATLTTVHGAQQIAVTGPMRAGITDATQFDGPALLEGLQGDTLTVMLNHGSYSMNIDSPNETASLQMTPIKHPAPPRPPGKPHGR